MIGEDMVMLLHGAVRKFKLELPWVWVSGQAHMSFIIPR